MLLRRFFKAVAFVGFLLVCNFVSLRSTNDAEQRGTKDLAAKEAHADVTSHSTSPPCTPSKANQLAKKCTAKEWDVRFACLGYMTGHWGETKKTNTYWNERSAKNAVTQAFPILHGGVTPVRLYALSRCILNIAHIDPSQSYSVGEIGTGIASLLFMLCPPRQDVVCYGVDPAASGIELARQKFAHLQTFEGISLANVTSHLFDVVIMVSVTMYQTPDQFCQTMEDALMSLKPGGIVQIWGLSSHRHGVWDLKWGRSRVHPNVFSASSPLWMCTGDLAQYVKSARAVAYEANECPKGMLYDSDGDFVGVVVRNDVEAKCLLRQGKEATYGGQVEGVRYTERGYDAFISELLTKSYTDNLKGPTKF